MAKLLSLLAVQSKPLSESDLERQNFAHKSLPVITISVSGTGTELAPALMLPHAESAQPICLSGPELFPRAAFFDYRYARRVSLDTLVSTVFCAIGNAVDVSLSEESSKFARAISQESLANTGAILSGLSEDQVDNSILQMLQYDAVLAGIAAAQIPLRVLYEVSSCLARMWQIPRGHAAGLLLIPYFQHAEKKKPYVTDTVLAAMGLQAPSTLQQKISLLIVNRLDMPKPLLQERLAAMELPPYLTSRMAGMLSQQELQSLAAQTMEALLEI